MKKMNFGTFLFSTAIFFSGQAFPIVIDSDTISSDLTNSSNQNIVEIAEKTADLSTFMKALNASGLTSSLEETGPFTIFAPSNSAFAALPAKTLEDLMKKENKSVLASLVKNHVVKGAFLSSNLNAGNLPTLGNKPLHVDVRGSQITVDNANIVQPDIIGSNGVIQVIDTVLFAQ